LGEGKQIMGTVGGEILTGEEAPGEVIDASTVAGSRQPEPAEARQLTPEQQKRMMERRTEAQERREKRGEAGEAGQPE
jgi:hypothetical protein